MKKVLVIATTKDRQALFSRLLLSIMRFKRWNEWTVAACMQGYSGAETQAARGMPGFERVNMGVFTQARTGPHTARLVVLDAIGADVYANLDDDMVFTPETNYDAAIEKTLDRKTGLVGANWARSVDGARRKTIKDTFVKQGIVYTGGGLLYGRHVVPRVQKIGRKPLWCDNTAWSLATYLAGLENYRFLGSVAIHNVCGPGGRKAWVKGHEGLVYPDSRFIRWEQGRIPTPSGITEEARRIHERNRPS